MLMRTVLWMTFFEIGFLRGQVTLEAHTDRERYLIGDHIRIELELSGIAGAEYIWDEDFLSGDIELIAKGTSDTVLQGNRIKIKQQFIAGAYTSGNLWVPAAIVRYRLPGDTAYRTAQSDSLAVLIEAIAVDTTQSIKPIADILDVTIKNALWRKILLWIHIAFVIGFLLWYFVVRRKDESVHEISPVAPGIYQLAMEKLQQLEQKKLWQQDLLKEYYSELTEILRWYLAERFGMHTLEQTSEEIMLGIAQHPETISHSAGMQYVFDLADMAKFAKSHPVPEENIRAMQVVRSLIEQTQPLETEQA